MAMPGINPYAIQMQQLQRRQQLADAMMQQSQQPLDTQFTGGQTSVAVRRSPFEALAKVAQAGLGAYVQNKNDQTYQDIATQMMKARDDSFKEFSGESGYPSATVQPGSSGAMPSAGMPSGAGVPPAPSPSAPTANLPPPLITNPGYTPPPAPTPAAASTRRSPAQMLSAAQNAISYGADPELVKAIVASQLKPPGNEPNSVREYEFAKNDGFKGSFQDWVAAGGQSSRPSSVQEWEFYNGLMQGDRTGGTNNAKLYLEMKRNPNMIVRDVGSVPTVVAPSVSGTSTVPLSTLGQEAHGAETLKQAEARGSTMGKARGDIEGGIETKGANAVGTQNLLDIADPLIDAATGSTVGAGADAVSKFFGKPTSGAEAIAKLKVLQAGLMTSMPRMEGPQSDRDVQLYRDASGQIGDPTVPADIKKAALQTIRQIQQKYVERANGRDSFGPKMPLGTIGGPNSYSRPKPPAAPVGDDALLKKWGG